jgi:hypothetical protein
LLKIKKERRRRRNNMSEEEKKLKETALNDDAMDNVTGGKKEFKFSDFFENEKFDKKLVDDGTKK